MFLVVSASIMKLNNHEGLFLLLFQHVQRCITAMLSRLKTLGIGYVIDHCGNG